GQNFVIDPNTIRKVVDLAGLDGSESVLEIGAGAGSLTLGLAGAARRVVAVEVDARLLDVLREVTASLENVEVVEADALALDMSTVDASAVVANLPYNVAATVVLKVLEDAPEIRKLTVMTQREVGERLAAAPGSKTYGQTSVLAAYWSTARVASAVSRRAFFPVPNVDSAIVVLERRTPPPVEKTIFYSVVKGAFGQRRKTLRNSLTELAGSAEAAAAAIHAAGLPDMARAEDAGLDDFAAVAAALAATSPKSARKPAV
ncbi:MAG TPA: 16S rRNA (adenine(1518)-N(6)/adenine(1519)-N(6))-dimethyltransferase RsmA, partial [Actinomycetota bacterium]